MFGNALADSWAAIAMFIVMALWFVWALDVRNGYHTLVHLGGISIAVLVGARVVSIVMFGALARCSTSRTATRSNSLVHQHAYRYYPLLRRVVSWIVGVVTVLALMQVWGVERGRSCSATARSATGSLPRSSPSRSLPSSRCSSGKRST